MGRIAEEEREKLYVRLDKKTNRYSIFNSGDFIPKGEPGGQVKWLFFCPHGFILLKDM